MLKITKCPTCGSRRLKAVRRNFTRQFEGQRYTVPNLEFHECPDCGERLYGEQRCQQCGSFARRVGIGGPCPHCDQPVALSDLLDQEVITLPKR